jgi:hypothetical protein
MRIKIYLDNLILFIHFFSLCELKVSVMLHKCLWIPLQQRILAAPTVCNETHHLLMPVFFKKLLKIHSDIFAKILNVYCIVLSNAVVLNQVPRHTYPRRAANCKNSQILIPIKLFSSAAKYLQY